MLQITQDCSISSGKGSPNFLPSPDKILLCTHIKRDLNTGRSKKELLFQPVRVEDKAGGVLIKKQSSKMINPTLSNFQPWVLGGILPQKGSFHTPGLFLELLPVPFHPGESGAHQLYFPLPQQSLELQGWHISSQPQEILRNFLVEDLPLKENPTRAAFCASTFPWDAENVRSCPSLGWSTSTFALGIKTAPKSEPGFS